MCGSVFTDVGSKSPLGDGKYYQADLGGNVAEYLGMPYVSIAMFPPLVQDDRIPPFCFGI